MSETIKANEYNGELLVPVTVETKKSVERNHVWNSEQITSVEYLPVDAPFNMKLYARLQMSYLNQRSILESLLLNSGAITIHNYMDLMQEMEKNIKELEQHYHTQAVSLLLVSHNNNKTEIDVKLFDTRELCDFYLKGLHNFTVEDIENGRVPNNYSGTRIFNQEWHASKDSILKSYPNITNTDLEPKSVAGEI